MSFQEFQQEARNFKAIEKNIIDGMSQTLKSNNFVNWQKFLNVQNF